MFLRVSIRDSPLYKNTAKERCPNQRIGTQSLADMTWPIKISAGFSNPSAFFLTVFPPLPNHLSHRYRKARLPARRTAIGRPRMSPISPCRLYRLAGPATRLYKHGKNRRTAAAAARYGAAYAASRLRVLLDEIAYGLAGKEGLVGSKKGPGIGSGRCLHSQADRCSHAFSCGRILYGNRTMSTAPRQNFVILADDV